MSPVIIDSLCFILVCNTEIKFPVSQAEAEKPKQSRQKKNCLAMKTLNLEQMVDIEGGKNCGKAGAIMDIAGGVLAIVALCNPITGLIGGLALAYGTSFAVAGIGCGIAALFD